MGCFKITYYQEGGLEKSTVHFFWPLGEKRGQQIFCIDYYPFGLTFNSSERSGYTTNRFLYNGKELQEDLNLDWYDYGARMYDAAIGRWHVVDPLSERYINESPYCYVGNRPMIMIDPDGMAYRPTTDSTGAYTGFEWVDDSEAYDDDGNLLDGYFDKAILFQSNGNWTIGTNSQGRYVSYNIGSATATVYDYEEVESEDGTVTKTPITSTYEASTESSDPSSFGTIEKNQLLHAVRWSHRGQYMALQMRTASGSANLSSSGKPPFFGDNAYQVRGGNIHKAGRNNFTGTFYKQTGYKWASPQNSVSVGPPTSASSISVPIPVFRYSGVSEGCFLIKTQQWNSFMNHFPSGVGRIGVINK